MVFRARALVGDIFFLASALARVAVRKS